MSSDADDAPDLELIRLRGVIVKAARYERDFDVDMALIEYVARVMQIVGETFKR